LLYKNKIRKIFIVLLPYFN